MLKQKGVVVSQQQNPTFTISLFDVKIGIFSLNYGVILSYLLLHCLLHFLMLVTSKYHAQGKTP